MQGGHRRSGGQQCYGGKRGEGGGGGGGGGGNEEELRRQASQRAQEARGKVTEGKVQVGRARGLQPEASWQRRAAGSWSRRMKALWARRKVEGWEGLEDDSGVMSGAEAGSEHGDASSGGNMGAIAKGEEGGDVAGVHGLRQGLVVEEEERRVALLREAVSFTAPTMPQNL